MSLVNVMGKDSIQSNSGRMHVALAALLVTAMGMFDGAYAKSDSDAVIVPPGALPPLARQAGVAMLLSEREDGRALLYIEQPEGSRLVVLDVTDPARVKSVGTSSLNAPGRFDFVAAVGKSAELIRFRGGQGSAVLDLRRELRPTLLPAATDTGPQEQAVLVNNDGSRAVATNVGAEGYTVHDYPVVDVANSQDRVPIIRQVSQDVTNADTGTTFLLTAEGLYLIRRPKIEALNKVKQAEIAERWGGR